jgi:hypothetical protein
MQKFSGPAAVDSCRTHNELGLANCEMIAAAGPLNLHMLLGAAGCESQDQVLLSQNLPITFEH